MQCAMLLLHTLLATISPEHLPTTCPCRSYCKDDKAPWSKTLVRARSRVVVLLAVQLLKGQGLWVVACSWWPGSWRDASRDASSLGAG